MGTLLGTRVRQTTKLPLHCKSQAEHFRIQLEKDIADGVYVKTKGRKFGDAVELYLTNSRAETEYRVCKSLHSFAHRAYGVDTITKIDSFLSENWSGGTLRRYRNVVNAIINNANKMWSTNVPRIVNPYVHDERTEHLTNIEVSKLLVVAKKQHFSEHIHMLTLTGLRLGEALALVHTDWDATKSSITIHKRAKSTTGRTKTLSRSIPVTNQFLIDHLNSKRNGDVLEKVSSKDLNTHLRALLKGIGVTRDIRVHDLRHTFAYLLAQNGADIGDLQLLLGHSDISQTMRYRGWVESRAKQNISKALTF